MDVETYVVALTQAGDRLSGAAGAAGLGAAVPGCPDWTVADLVTHVGGVHRWATWYVTTGRRTASSADEDRVFFSPSGDLLAWFDRGVGALTAALRAAPADLECWTFLPAASPRTFWARRQSHETTVHAADALAAAGGRTSPVPPELGADGVDELLGGFFARPGRGPTADPAVTLRLVATDGGQVWTLRIGPTGPRLEPSGAGPSGDEPGSGAEPGVDCQVRGAAGDLYLLVWNRTPAGELQVDGDRSVLDRWHSGATVTWD